MKGRTPAIPGKPRPAGAGRPHTGGHGLHRVKKQPIYLMDGTPEGIPSNLLLGADLDSAELCVQFRLDLAELRL